MTITYALEDVLADTRLNTLTLAADFSNLTALADGGFVVAYAVHDPATLDKPVINIYNADGSVRGTFHLPSTSVTSGIDTFGPAIAQLSNGNIAVVWSEKNGSTWTMRSSLYDTSGNLVPGATQGRVLATGTGDFDPGITALADGKFAVGYFDDPENVDIVDAAVVRPVIERAVTSLRPLGGPCSRHDRLAKRSVRRTQNGQPAQHHLRPCLCRSCGTGLGSRSG